MSSDEEPNKESSQDSNKESSKDPAKDLGKGSSKGSSKDSGEAGASRGPSANADRASGKGAGSDSGGDTDREPGRSRRGGPRSIFQQIQEGIESIIVAQDLSIEQKIEVGMRSIGFLAARGAQGARAAVDVIVEFVEALGTVESFKIHPKPPLALEVDIKCKHETEIAIKKQLFPFIELEAMQFGTHINFETLMNMTRKGLQLNVNEGIELRINLGPLGVQNMPVRGNVLLGRDDRGEIVLITTHAVPGSDELFTTTVPIRRIIEGASATFKKRKPS